MDPIFGVNHIIVNFDPCSYPCNQYICYVQVEILYKLQLVQEICSLYKLQLVQAPYLSFEKCILMNLYFKIYKISISDLIL